jgi:hypothetical protein
MLSKRIYFRNTRNSINQHRKSVSQLTNNGKGMLIQTPGNSKTRL